MPFIFDVIIVGYLLAAFFLFMGLWHDRHQKKFWESRHPILRTIALSLILASWLLVFYGSFIEPNIFAVKSQAIDLPNYHGTPLRLAVISDLHIGPYKTREFLRRAVKKIETLSPDAVLIAGDIVYNKASQTKHLAPLKNLAGKFPVYAVLGDHDYHLKFAPSPTPANNGLPATILNEFNNATLLDNNRSEIVTKALEQNGIIVLSNKNSLLKNLVWLAGLEDIATGRADCDAALAGTDDQLPRLLLVHNPDAIFYPQISNIDLIIAGHTHAGQIRLPLIGSLARIPTYLGNKYGGGVFNIATIPDAPTSAKTKLFITSGIGESGPRTRLFNPPEIAILTIF